MTKDVRLIATKMFSDLYKTIGQENRAGEIIDQSFDSYLNSQNLSSIDEHMEYKELYDKLKMGVK